MELCGEVWCDERCQEDSAATAAEGDGFVLGQVVGLPEVGDREQGSGGKTVNRWP